MSDIKAIIVFYLGSSIIGFSLGWLFMDLIRWLIK